MSWKTTVFEREALYKEIWAEPVRVIAQRYGLSDVGLRKICAKLGVPLPRFGYWARVAAGQKPRIPVLPTKHKGETRYVRQIHIDPQADERSTRVQALLGELSPPRWPAIAIKADDADLHPVAQRTDARMAARTKKATGLFESRGDDTFDVRASEAHKGRALRIADAVISAVLTAGGTLVPHRKDGGRVHLDVLGEHVELRIEELLDRSLRDPTPAEKARQAKESWYKPDLAVYTPTGKLKLTLFNPARYNPLLTASDGTSKPLGQRLDDILPRLWAKLAELRVEAQMREEESERWRQQAARQAEWEAARRAELARLEKVEEAATQWSRAAELRRYADALEQAATPPAVAAEVAWIRKAADWLDPLMRKHWAEVDGDRAEPDNKRLSTDD